jgi:hypothetical protein
MPAPGDYDDGEIGGMMIGRRNGSTNRKHAPVRLCLPQIPHACSDANLGRRGGKPSTNRLSYGMALVHALERAPTVIGRVLKYSLLNILAHFFVYLIYVCSK